MPNVAPPLLTYMCQVHFLGITAKHNANLIQKSEWPMYQNAIRNTFFVTKAPAMLLLCRLEILPKMVNFRIKGNGTGPSNLWH